MAVQHSYSEARQKHWRRKSEHWVFSKRFSVVVAAAIIGQTFALAFHTQDELNEALMDANKDDDSPWRIVDRCFTVFFLFEVMARYYFDRKHFFDMPEARWNFFDLFLVLQSVLLIIFRDFHLMQPFRMFLILRFVRFLRIIRIARFFHSFRIMIFSIAHSLPALAWVLFLMLFVLGTFAIVIVHGFMVAIRFGGNHGPLTQEQIDLISPHYGGLYVAAETLFRAITGGNDWHELVDPLKEAWWVLAFIFYSYIFFMVFGVLNVVTSIFVDSTYRASQKDPDIAIQSAIEQNREYVEELRVFFKRADVDNSSMLSFTELLECLESPEVQAYFNALDLDSTKPDSLFKLLGGSPEKEISIDEFIKGCQQLRGQAKTLDVALLLEKQEGLQKFVEARFREMQDSMKVAVVSEERGVCYLPSR